MTLFRTKLSALPAPVSPGSKPCPNWNLDYDRLRILQNAIARIRSVGGAGYIITTEVLDKVSANSINVSGPTSGAYTLNLPIPADLAKINLYNLSDFTITYAQFYIQEKIREGRNSANSYLGTSPSSTTIPAINEVYDGLKDLFTADSTINQPGFTKIVDVVNLLDERLNAKDRNKNIIDLLQLPSTNYDYAGAKKAPQFIAEQINNKLMSLLFEYVSFESQCLYQFILSSYSSNIVPPEVVFAAVGDGGTTQGFLDISNNGLMFFNYDYKKEPNLLVTQSKRKVKIQKVGNGFNTTLYFSIYGINDLKGNPTLFSGDKFMIIKVTLPRGASSESITFNVRYDTTPIFSGSPIQKGFYLKQIDKRVPSALTSKINFTTAKNYLIIKDTTSGTIDIEIDAATKGGGPDEVLTLIHSIQEQPNTVSFELNGLVQYADNKFLLSNTTKYNSGNPSSGWKIWNTAQDIQNLNKLIDFLKETSNTVRSDLRGRYTGKRGIPYNSSSPITFQIGDYTYFNNSVYKCIISTSNSPSTSPSNWVMIYTIYNPLGFSGTASTPRAYNKGDIILVPISSTHYSLYESLQRGVAGPFDQTKWKQISSVIEEENSSKLEFVNSIANLSTYHDSLRYSFADLQIGVSELTFSIDSFVSPIISRLDASLFADLTGTTSVKNTIINNFNIGYTTSIGSAPTPISSPTSWPISEFIAVAPINSSINTDPYIPIYNIPLSYLRSMGFLRALFDRIIDETQIYSPSNKTYIENKLNDAFNLAVLEIPIARNPILSRNFTTTATFTNAQWLLLTQ